MTDQELLRFMARHSLVWADLPDKTFCFIFDDKFKQRDLDTAQAQRFQDAGWLKPLPPFQVNGPTVQYRLSKAGWDALLGCERFGDDAILTPPSGATK
jgi:hypothetical protein